MADFETLDDWTEEQQQYAAGIAFWAHDDIRILYDFKFYVPHSTSDDVSSLFVMFFCENYF